MSSSVTTNPRTVSATHTPSTATQATCSLAASPGGTVPTPGSANSRWICTAITASIAAGATAQTPIVVNLRDGATGAGTVLWSAALSAPVNGSAWVGGTDLNIRGSANTAMTLEFTGAGVTASQQTVSLSGYIEDLSGP